MKYKISNTVSFAAFYKSLKYTIIEQKQEVELSDLISNIGGVIGVFLGISFLSFVEVFELLFEIMTAYFENPKIRHPASSALSYTERDRMNLSQNLDFTGKKQNKAETEPAEDPT